MSIGVLPNSIPKTGERYNMTFDRGGQGKGGKIARFVIDGGKYIGKKVSCVCDEKLATKLYEFVLTKEADVPTDKDVPAFWIYLNQNSRHIRFSGKLTVIRQACVNDEMIHVPEDYQESNVMVTYHISAFAKATAPTELNLKFSDANRA